jgi:hypothetical protein
VTSCHDLVELRWPLDEETQSAAKMMDLRVKDQEIGLIVASGHKRNCSMLDEAALDESEDVLAKESLQETKIYFRIARGLRKESGT